MFNGFRLTALACGVVAIALNAFASALAADLPVPGPPPYVVAPALPYNWTGLYFGLSLGAGWTDHAVTDSQFGITFKDGADFVGGGQFGLNYQTGMLVVGIEGDYDFLASGRTGNTVTTPAGPIQATSNNSWLFTLAGRLGVAYGRALFYGKAGGGLLGNRGLALNDSATNVSISPSTGAASAGWLVGAGTEWALTSNWTFKIEYNFLGLNRSNAVVPASAPFLVGDTFTAAHNIQTVQIGFNYLIGRNE